MYESYILIYSVCNLLLFWIGFEVLDYIEIQARRRKIALDRNIPLKKVHLMRQGFFSRTYKLEIKN